MTKANEIVEQYERVVGALLAHERSAIRRGAAKMLWAMVRAKAGCVVSYGTSKAAISLVARDMVGWMARRLSRAQMLRARLLASLLSMAADDLLLEMGCQPCQESVGELSVVDTYAEGQPVV